MKSRLLTGFVAVLLAGAASSASADALPRLGCIYYGSVRNCYGGHIAADDNVRLTVYRKGVPLTWCTVGAASPQTVDYNIKLSTVAPGQTPDVGTAVEGETNTLAATVNGALQSIIGSTNLVVGGRGACVNRDYILGTDANANGLPDEWEAFVLQGFQAMGRNDVTMINPNDDLNGNGVSNLSHFLAGTFPFLPDDTLRIAGYRPASSGVFEFTVLANSGFRYGVHTTTNIAGGVWTDAKLGTTVGTAGQGDTVAGAGGTMTVYVPTNGVKAFYRLIVK